MYLRRAVFLALALSLLSACRSLRADDRPVRLPQAAPALVGMDAERLARIDATVQAALERGQLPGAVVLVARHGKVVFRKAYGLRSKEPAEEAMTPDTLFDLASLTKPIATATAVMVLLEQGKLRLSDRVARHWPDFSQGGKERITIEQLLLHTSGLIADNPLRDYQDGREKALERICRLPPTAEPGSRFIYSDVNFIVLGELVGRLSGEPLDAFVRRYIFEPLGMRETMFRPPSELARRVAPTEKHDGDWLRGQVHDPRARLLGGVAGHAGLFATADDLAVYAQMLLNGGEYNGARVLSPAAVRLMTTPRAVPGGLRALGWDMRTSYSANRGELFGDGSFGHTGFTGTSIWIDPASRTTVIFLSNRLHPTGKGDVTRLRGQVATLAAAAIVAPPLSSPLTPDPSPPRTGEGENYFSPLSRNGGEGLGMREPSLYGRTPHPQPLSPQEGERGGRDTSRTPEGREAKGLAPVLTGIDVLKRDGFRALRGRRVGLVTNHTGVDRDGTSTIDLLYQAEGVSLVALFSPEHGIRGQVDRPVPDAKDEKTGLPIYSLYGERKRPTAEQLEGIDTLVYDIQDIGCRFYTYITTLGYLLETAAAHKKKVVVLDRPNPIGGLAVEGPVLQRGLESFTGYHALPVRHGLTVGELALLFNRERGINADLEVIEMEGWRRGDTYDRTGLLWINPSPNMRSLTAALLYPGIGLLETTNLSVGRGTDRPFEQIGAPWLDGRRLAEALAQSGLPGVRFVPTRFTPSGSVHAGKECGGVQIFIDDWQRFRSLETGLTIAYQLKRLYPNDWQTKRYPVLLAHPPTFEALERGDTPEQIRALWQDGLAEFLAMRQKYLLY
ncbi:MAG TPA: exo-beta-N-acetylmuramidase NamZ domain-containing protein [Gemmataceae bacterium]|nr:exo-beta-N-acetylmuramidase NamZ domain-containing protein [Gemmataceae bacterium]